MLNIQLIDDQRAGTFSQVIRILLPLLPSPSQVSLFSKYRAFKAKPFSVRNVSPFLSAVLAEAYHWILFHNTLFAQTLKTGSRKLPPPTSGMSQTSGCSVRGCWKATAAAASHPYSLTSPGRRKASRPGGKHAQKETPKRKCQERNPALLTYWKLSQ